MIKKVSLMTAFLVFITILHPATAPKRIVFDESHNLFKMEKAFPLLFRTLTLEGYGIETSRTLDLNSDVVVLMMPSDEFTRLERKGIVEYVKNGGGLLVVCEWGLYADYRHILVSSNSISNEFGVTFKRNLVYESKNSFPKSEMWAKITNMRKHPITEGVPFFFYPSGDSMVLSERSGMVAWGSHDAWGETGLWGDGYFLPQDYFPYIFMGPRDFLKRDKVAQSPDTMKSGYDELKYNDLVVLAAFGFGKGKVVFIGDSDVFAQSNPENVRLVKNIFRWLST